MPSSSTKFYISELLLGLYLVAYIVFDASKTYTKYDNYLALAFMLCVVIELGFKGFLGLRRLEFIYPIAGLMALSWLTLVFNLDGFKTQITYTLNFCLFIAVFLLIRTTRRTWPIEVALALGVLIIWKTQGADFAEVKKFKGERLEFNLGDDDGLNANLYGFYLVLSLFFTVKFLFVDSVIGKKSMIWWARCSLMSVTSIIAIQQIVFVTGSRKAQLMMLASMLVGYLVYVSGNKERRIAKTVLGTVACFVAVIFLWHELKESDHFTRLESLLEVVRYGGTSEESAGSRIVMAKKAISMWFESPIWGHGTGAFATKAGFGHYCHCGYLEILCSYGIIGFVLYYGVVFKTLRLTYRWKKSRFQSVTKHSIWIFVMLLSTSVLFETFAVTYTEGMTAVYLGCVFGLVSFLGSKMGVENC